MWLYYEEVCHTGAISLPLVLILRFYSHFINYCPSWNPNFKSVANVSHHTHVPLIKNYSVQPGVLGSNEFIKKMDGGNLRSTESQKNMNLRSWTTLLHLVSRAVGGGDGGVVCIGFIFFNLVLFLRVRHVEGRGKVSVKETITWIEAIHARRSSSAWR